MSMAQLNITCITLLTDSKRHKTLNQCWFNVGPASQTVDEHYTNIDSTSCVRWVNPKKINDIEQ